MTTKGSDPFPLIALGLDLSLTSTGWAVWGGDVGRIRTDVGHPKKEGLKGIERRNWIAGGVFDLLDRQYPLLPLVVIEAVPTHGAHSLVPLAMLHGVVLDFLPDNGCAVAYVPGSVLKKHLAGKGNADKHQMVAAAQAVGYKGNQADEADAYGLALIGHHLLGGQEHRTAMRDACLANVSWEVPLPTTEAAS